jgi:hypothetical protein
MLNERIKSELLPSKRPKAENPRDAYFIGKFQAFLSRNPSTLAARTEFLYTSSYLVVF